MKLNLVEKALMNNPVRAALQRRYEAAVLERLGGQAHGARALEIGCGRGVGVEIILRRFGARTVEAFDFDPDMVRRARTRLARYGDAVRLYVADASAIPVPDAAFGADFDFGIVHHVPQWRLAVSEVTRVLRPGGTFYFEEVTKHALDRASYRLLFEHPSKDRFTADDFVGEIESSAMDVGGRYVTRFFGDLLIGVATRR